MTGEDDWKRSGKENFDKQLLWVMQRGATLSVEQADFLREARRQAFRTHGNPPLHPKPMTNAQRSMKADLISRWRAGLDDLQLLGILSAESCPWFKLKDAKKVLDKDALVRVVSICAQLFGREYADAILEAVRRVYEEAGEEIVVQRRLWRHPFVHELGR